jgi:transposase, IS30 family
VGRAAGDSVRSIARRLGRSPATVSRELRRNADRRGEYRATTAHARAWERASRPKPAKLVVDKRLRAIVQHDLERKYSPEQIAGRLRLAFPDEPEMWVSTETIYQSLYVTSRGGSAPRADQVLADRRVAAQALTAGGGAQPGARHDQHRPAPSGSR